MTFTDGEVRFGMHDGAKIAFHVPMPPREKKKQKDYMLEKSHGPQKLWSKGWKDSKSWKPGVLDETTSGVNHSSHEQSIKET